MRRASSLLVLLLLTAAAPSPPAPPAPPASQPAGAIIGIVLDTAGKPAADVVVAAQQAGQKMRDPIQGATDADGKFRLENVAEGQWNLKFRTRDGKLHGTKTVDVIEGKTANAGTIKLRGA